MTKKSVTIKRHRDGSISMKSTGGVDLRGVVDALAGRKKCVESDHQYEKGAFDVCRRCGGEKP